MLPRRKEYKKRIEEKIVMGGPWKVGNHTSLLAVQMLHVFIKLIGTVHLTWPTLYNFGLGPTNSS